MPPTLAGPGEPHLLGATWDGDGTNFAVYSRGAEEIELCLFDADNNETRVRLPDQQGHIHHGYFIGVGPGQRYGLRAHGPWDAARGLRFNANKLLLDPYARAIEGEVSWDGPLTGHDPEHTSQPDRIDSAPYVPKAMVTDRHFDWADDRPPNCPWNRTVIYETHVKGISMLHPDVPPELRGTYAGMATEPVVSHLVDLGVTAVELLPVHQFLHEGFLTSQGLRNYWGYQTLGFFAPHKEYAADQAPGAQVAEFKSLVKALHQAGIEVILDVVYNHTVEGSANGPTLSLRGLDNHTYYRLEQGGQGDYVNYSGTGNTLNVDNAATLRLVMDSLRYWVQEMHVDGFRFDLASSLARDDMIYSQSAAFFTLVHQDPVLNRVKLIAEPWDLGPHGYQLGHFPQLWSEWNAAFRDDTRDFWRAESGSMSRFASRFAGSADIFQPSRRRPRSSINFLTAHDGFTLRDLVSYNDRHNEANGEDGNDGHSDNRSWNSGIEGPTEDPEIVEVRRRRSASMMVSLLLAQGVPMICGGDELGRSQQGNNNAYGQDNPISWYHWDDMDAELLETVRSLIRFRHQHPVFRRRHFFTGQPAGPSPLVDLGWYRPDGAPMTPDDWEVGYARAVAVFANGETVMPQEFDTEPVLDSSFLVLFNASPEPIQFLVPSILQNSSWQVCFDTANVLPAGHWFDPSHHRADRQWDVDAWAVVVLERGNSLSSSAHGQTVEA